MSVYPTSDIYEKRKDELHKLALRQRRELSRLKAAQEFKNKKIEQLEHKLKKAREHNTAIAEEIKDAFYDGWQATRDGWIDYEAAWEASNAYGFLNNKGMA